MKALLFLISSILFISMAKGQSADEQRIRYLEKHWTQLLDAGDTTALLKLWTADYVVNNPGGRILTPKDVIGLMKGGHQFPAVERLIENISFHQNIAVVMGKELQQPASGTANKEEWIPRRFTNVWIKTADEWQLAARQSSPICAD